MAYKPFGMPEDLHAWLKARAERLTEERGTDVSMNDVLREVRALVESVDPAPVAPQAQNPAQPAAVQP